MLQLITLGTYALRLQDRDAPAIPTQKARALLAYLAMHREAAVARERLLELFWPDADPESARGNLKTATWSIRRSLKALGVDPDEYLDAGRTSMRWIGAMSVDAQELLDAAGDDDPNSDERALALYAGAFLEGDYDEWAASQREQIETAYETVLQRCLDRTHDPEYAHKILERNPYNEEAHAAIVDAHAGAGRPLAARAAVEAARHILRQLDANVAAAFESRYEALMKAGLEPGAAAPAVGSLPRYAQSIVGRDREFDELHALLESSRAVSVVGAGGIGKTRLAVHVAQAASDADDGPDVRFVDLGRIADPTVVTPAVAGAIGIELSPGRDPLDTLVRLMRPLRVLLVLDNCEHLVVQVANLAERLIYDCPDVTILATSREALGIEGETVYRLDTLDDASAQALFVARAKQSDQRWELAPSEEPIVGEICRRLDGIALAVELAAARAHAMPLDRMLSRLDERFALLEGKRRSVQPRQQTMLALIDWSYQLLDERERAAFRRLGVFAGSFTLDAASAVAICDNDAIFALVEKSMVARTYEGTTRRYRLLESMRDFARVRLREAGDATSAHRAHADYFAAVAAELEASFGQGSEEEWTATYEPDLANFRAALDWAVVEDVSLAARLIGNLTELWYCTRLDVEGLQRSQIVLAALGSRWTEPNAIGVLLAVASLAWRTGHTQQGIDAGERAYAIAREKGDLAAMAQARGETGRLRILIGAQPERAESDLREAVEYARKDGNVVRAAPILTFYAVALAARDPNESRRLLHEQVEALRLAGWPNELIVAEYSLAEIEFRIGEITAAAQRSGRLIEFLRARKDPHKLAQSLQNFASYQSVAGEYELATAAGREAVSIARLYRRERRVALAGQALALVEAANGDAVRGARLLGYADAYYAEVLERAGSRREPTEAVVAAKARELLEKRLAPEALARELATGAALTMEAAAALALGEPGVLTF